MLDKENIDKSKKQGTKDNELNSKIHENHN